jgi:zinc transporter ZupT
MSPFLNVLIFGSLAGLATLFGIFLVVKKEKWVRDNLIYLLSFSAGILLSFSLIHLLPEAVAENSSAYVITLLSFFGFYIIEHALSIHNCEKNKECPSHQTFSLVSWMGLLIHSAIDGIVIGAGFEVSFSLGILSTLAVLLHEFPEGISTMSVMLYGGDSIKQAIKKSIWVAVATPIGALLTFFILRNINSSVVGFLLALASGSFLYVAASDLIPEIHKKSKWTNIFLTFLGLLIPISIEKLL